MLPCTLWVQAVGVERSTSSSSSSSEARAAEQPLPYGLPLAAGTRKRRREEDHFFNSRRDSLSHGREEAEAEAALEAEALALELENPWACQACTVINVAERISCQVLTDSYGSAAARVVVDTCVCVSCVGGWSDVRHAER